MLRGACFRTPYTTNISHSKSYTSISTSNNASLKDKSLPYHVIFSWRYPSSDGISENEKFREARNPRAHCSLAYNFCNLRQISWEGCRNSFHSCFLTFPPARQSACFFDVQTSNIELRGGAEEKIQKIKNYSCER